MSEQPKLYIEDNNHKIGIHSFVPDEVYSAAISAFVIVTTDTIIINRRRQTVYLAKRIVRPMKGWWIVGGRMLAGEKEIESVRRTFHRETSLNIDPKRFKFLRLNRYFWKDREQEPHNIGSDGLAYTFFLELTPKEIKEAACHLEPREFDPSFGLQEFDRERLVREKVHESIIDMYDQLFSESASL